MVSKITRFVLIAVLAGAAACADSGSLDEIKKELSSMKQQQQALLDKVTSIDTALKSRPAQPPQQPQQPPPPAGPFTVSKANASIRGNPKAPAVIVEWSDFQCPFCSKIAPALEETLKDPEISGKVQFVFKQYPLPFHNKATPAAKASLAAGRQGKFFEMHDKIFTNQQQMSDENYLVWAKEIGLNVERFKKDIADPKLDEIIKADMDEGAKTGVRGTPSVYIGTNDGDVYTVMRSNGPRTPEGFKQEIKAALAKKG
jgi:protein-disulfide isomerase